MNRIVYTAKLRIWALSTILIFACAFAGCSGSDAPEDDAGLLDADAGSGHLDAGSDDDTSVKAIVVLGSSTAFGLGPSEPGNAWVRRYERHLADQHPYFTVTNLAVPGFTTYHIQQDGYVPPEERPDPDPDHNISAALALDPAAIIVNLPSNDQTAGYSTEEQMDNYARVADLADQSHVSTWIATSQPRNLITPEGQQNLMDVRDQIVLVYGDFSIDFWTGLAESDGTIRPEFDADGIHLNDDGHEILVQRVVDKQIPTQVSP